MVLSPKPLREAWFGSESAMIVDRAVREWESWYDAADLGELEQRTCRETGAVLLRRFESDYSTGNSFGPWFAHLAKTASDRALALLHAGDDAWRGPACLLLGIAAVRHVDLKNPVDTAMNRLRKALDRDGWPEAFARLAGERIAPTGRAWTAADAYGDQYGLVMETVGSETDEPRYYLVAVEMAADNVATFAGEYWTIDDAFTAWRQHVGASAAGAEPRPFESGSDLWFLMYLGDPGDITHELDLGPIFREYFRAQRRLEDLVADFRARGLEIRDPASLYHPDVESDFEPFMAWLSERRPELDGDAIGSLAFAIIEEWLMGSTAPTAYAVSPRRVASRSLLVLDMYREVDGFQDLMREWVRYCAAKTGLDESLAEAAVAAVPADRDEAMKFERDFEPPAADR
jgi:hypothetical protein